jgi:hypothetical protein
MPTDVTFESSEGRPVDFRDCFDKKNPYRQHRAGK